jgi:hypothetical protein
MKRSTAKIYRDKLKELNKIDSIVRHVELAVPSSCSSHFFKGSIVNLTATRKRCELAQKRPLSPFKKP